MITAPRINEEKLKEFLHHNYAYTILQLTFLPKGETSWIYIVETTKGKFILKLYTFPLPLLEEATQLTYTLYTTCGITQIVHAIQAKNSKTINVFETYPAVLFNFIPGKEMLEQKLTDQQVEELGIIIGKVHKATHQVGEFPRKETFTSKDREVFFNVVERIQSHAKSENVYERQLIDLFLAKKERIMQEYSRLDDMSYILAAKNLPFVLCHSDPTAGNILIGEKNELFIIDWDTPLLAPKERDLFFFQERLEPFMKGYTSIVGETVLDNDVLEFYRLEWNVQEIADFGSRILFQKNSNEQNMHDLKRVKEFLEYSGIGD